MRNCKELRDALASTFRDLRSGKIQAKDAAALANLAGKMVNSAKVQIEYQTLHKKPRPIQFLESD